MACLVTLSVLLDERSATNPIAQMLSSGACCQQPTPAVAASAATPRWVVVGRRTPLLQLTKT